MIEIEARVKKWGNSFGVILPKKVIDREKIKEGVKVNITILPRNKMTVAKLLQLAKRNKLPRLKKSTNQLMREMDRELWPE